MMISYAQNFEDVMLNRVFRDRAAGFYVDVGAADPVHLSVTKAFYDRGWTGINIEPHPDFFKLLVEQRPRDINLNCGAGAADGEATLYEFPDKEWSSFADEVSTAAPGRAGPIGQRKAPVTTLNAILDTHAGGRHVDFLKIDVEGWEREVLQGLNLRRHRPTIILLEAVDRHTQAVNSDWEDILFAADYKPVHFDGLNKFYAPRENDRIEAHFAVPPNFFDYYQLNIVVELQKQIGALRWSISNAAEVAETQVAGPLAADDAANHAKVLSRLVHSLERERAVLAASLAESEAKREQTRCRRSIRIGPLLLGFGRK